MCFVARLRFSSVGRIFRFQHFHVFEQIHSKKVADLARTAKTMFFVKLRCSLKRFRSVQADPCAFHVAERRLHAVQQVGCNARSLPLWTDCHSSNMPFFSVDDVASDSAHNLAGFIDRHKQAHIRKSLANCLERQHRIQERLARVPVAIVFERRAQRFQDSRSITVRRATYQECSALRHTRALLHSRHRSYERTLNSASSILSAWLLDFASDPIPARLLTLNTVTQYLNSNTVSHHVF